MTKFGRKYTLSKISSFFYSIATRMLNNLLTDVADIASESGTVFDFNFLPFITGHKQDRYICL